MKEHARDPATALPDPRGRKSLPTMLSSTNDFPELWSHVKKRQTNSERARWLDLGRGRVDLYAEVEGCGSTYLPTDDSDGGERLPERAAAAAVVFEDGARARPSLED